MKGVQRPTAIALANNHHEYTSPVKYSSSRKHAANRSLEEDDDWILDTPKRRPPRASSFSEKKNAQNAAVVENDVNRIIRSVAEESGVPSVTKTPSKTEPQTPTKKPATVTAPAAVTTVATPIKSPAKSNVVNETKPASVTPNEMSPAKRAAQTKKENEKKRQMQVSLNESILFSNL